MNVKTDPNVTFDIPTDMGDNFGDYSDLIGTKWGTRYTLTKHLGGGGFGVVFEAADELFPTRPVAVKLGDPLTSRAIFKDEARRLSEVKHVNVVNVTGYGVAEENGGVPFIVMELLDGESVDKLITKYNSRVPDKLVVQFVREIGSALYTVHEKQIIHRDLKPNNIIYSKTQELEGHGEAVMRFILFDFGIAETTDPKASLSVKQSQGMGTIEYMSPEQVQGNHRCTHQSDIYTFGVMLYQLLTGKVPFPLTGTAPMQIMQVMSAIVEKPAPPFSEAAPDRVYPAGLEDLVMQCMSKKAEDRPVNMMEVRNRFLKIYGADRTQSDWDMLPPEQRAEQTPPPARFPFVTPLLVALCLSTVGALFWLSTRPVPVNTVPTVAPQPKWEVAAPLLALSAGEAKTLAVSFLNGGKESPSVEVLGRHEEINVSDQMEIVGGSGESTVVLLNVPISVDLNAKPGERELKLIAKQGDQQQELNVKLDIKPADFWKPSGSRFPVTFGGKLKRIDNRNLYEEVVFNVPGEPPVKFLLIDPGTLEGQNLSAFYIMENKVWNSLYEKFARELSVSLPDEKSAKVRGGDFPRLPAMGMLPNDAMHFGKWLEPHLTGLPTVRQWWAAAGLFDKSRPEEFSVGPFSNRVTAEEEQIKSYLNLPVGSSPRDVSPHGIRDMAINGKEWTSNTYPRNDRLTYPIKDRNAMLCQVGNQFENEKSGGRLLYESADAYFTDDLNNPPETFNVKTGDFKCGFRLVLECTPLQ